MFFSSRHQVSHSFFFLEICSLLGIHPFLGIGWLNKSFLSMMNKIVSTNIGHDVARLSMDMIGDAGLMSADDTGLGRIPNDHASWVSQYMWSLGIAIAGGTANIQRNVIAERGLGLPRDRAADREA